VLLTGPRRVGKSVALLDVAFSLCGRPDLDPRQVIHLPCDGFAARDLRRALTLGRELTRVVDQPETVPRVWLLDEVSSIEGWSSVLKAARDGSAFGAETVVATGSRWSTNDDIEGNLLAGRAGTSTSKVIEAKFGNGILATKSILDTNHPTWAVPAPLVALLLL
jgi:uncharacterized protein